MYVENEVTYPDHQLRLIRNVPGLSFYERVHQEIEVPGGHAILDRPHLFHFHYLLYERGERQVRLGRYEQLREGAGTGVYRKYYEFEDYPFAVRPCREAPHNDVLAAPGIKDLTALQLPSNDPL